MGLFQGASALVVIARRTGGHEILPFMATTEMAWDDVIDGQRAGMLTAILADKVIAAQDLALGQLDLRARSLDHPLQANDRGHGIIIRHRLDLAAPIQDHLGLTVQDQ